MRRFPGQAARLVGRIVHGVLALALVLALGGSVGIAALAWRLSQGPVDLPWLAQRMQEAANADAGAIRVSIASAALTWEGFRLGVDRPLDIRLRNIAVTSAAQGHSVVVPQIDVSLALGGLLLGRIQPRALEIDSARLVLLRTPAGDIRMDFGSAEATPEETLPDAGPSALEGLIAELARPPAAAGNRDRMGRFSQLRRVRIRHSTVTLIDRKLAVLWRAEAPEIDLRRLAQGGVEGSGSFGLAMGAERASVRVSGTLSASDGSIRLSAQLADLWPAALARQTGRLAPLEALDARLSGSLDLEIGPHQALRQIAFDLHAGPGKVTIGPSVVLLAGADLTAEGTDRELQLKAFSLRLLPREGGPVSTISGSGALHRNAGRLAGELSVAVDRVAFADLGQLWPRPIARPARQWVTDNITAGIARDGHVKVTLEGNEDLSDLAVASATGSLLGEGVTVHWLRPVAPIDRGTARLNILDPDTLEILVGSGRQTLDAGSQPPGPHESGLVIKSGKMRITGLMQKDQVGTINAEIAGPIADAVTLLRTKKLHLFDRFQLDLNDPRGQLSGTLAVTVPLEEKLKIEDVPIQAKLHLQDAHLGGLVAGHDLDRGNVDIVASTEGMKLTGRADIATIPTQIDAEMNFRSGSPSQVLRRIVASGRATTRQLAAVGLDAGEALAGSVNLKAVMTERRDGSGEILVDVDLAAAALRVAPIDWRKPVGQPATGRARLKLRGGRLVGIDDIALDGGEPLTLRARAAFAEGRIAGLTIDRATLGKTSGKGTVRFPPLAGNGAAGPIQIVVDGPSLDLSQVLSSKPEPDERRQAEDAKAGPSWALDARFDRVIMANATTASGLVAHAESDGRLMRQLHVEAQTGAHQGPASRFKLDIAAPTGSRKRTLSAVSDNAGDLLRAVDVARTMQGGRLTVSGTYDDTLADHPLSGTAEITDFRIQGAPALGRLLQAMTLYGLVDVVQGPGLGFSRLVAPFRLTRETLGLTDARAYSASLGLTVKGRIDLANDRLDLEGTIVPAYFFNSLLGNLPIIGRIFSPEEGGGLFAASYSLRGKTNDPDVTVNPLSALTPGFLRGLFGIF